MLLTAETMLLLYNGQVDQYLSNVWRLTTDMYIKILTNLHILTVTLVHAPMLLACERFWPLEIKASAWWLVAIQISSIISWGRNRRKNSTGFWNTLTACLVKKTSWIPGGRHGLKENSREFLIPSSMSFWSLQYICSASKSWEAELSVVWDKVWELVCNGGCLKNNFKACN